MLSADTNCESFLASRSLFRPDELDEGQSKDSLASVSPSARKAETRLFNPVAQVGGETGLFKSLLRHMLSVLF
jgi:hypothetical protein